MTVRIIINWCRCKR